MHELPNLPIRPNDIPQSPIPCEAPSRLPLEPEELSCRGKRLSDALPSSLPDGIRMSSLGPDGAGPRQDRTDEQIVPTPDDTVGSRGEPIAEPADAAPDVDDADRISPPKEQSADLPVKLVEVSHRHGGADQIATSIARLGLAGEAIAVSDGVLQAAGIKGAQRVDASVPTDAYQGLRQTEGWSEERRDDGKTVLKHDGGDVHLPVEVAAGWGDRSHTSLHTGSFVMNGARFAGLPAVYAHLQDKEGASGQADLALVKQSLFDRLMPREMSARERDFVQEHTPEHLQGHPAIQVAANGLLLVRTLYGSPEDGPARLYSGDVETNIPVLGHAYEHSADGLSRIARQVEVSNSRRLAEGLPPLYQGTDLAYLLAAIANHDSNIGDGRIVDETKSGLLLARHLAMAGCTDDRQIDRSQRGVRRTAFDDIAAKQIGAPSGEEDVLVDTVPDADIGCLADFNSPEISLAMGVEDLIRIRAGFDGILAEVINTYGLRIANLPGALAAIDLVREVQLALADKLDKVSTLQNNHRFSPTWELDEPQMRQSHAALMRYMSGEIRAGRLTASQCSQIVKKHEQLMRKRFGRRA